jgi:hypothetical protein
MRAGLEDRRDEHQGRLAPLGGKGFGRIVDRQAEGQAWRGLVGIVDQRGACLTSQPAVTRYSEQRTVAENESRNDAPLLKGRAVMANDHAPGLRCGAGDRWLQRIPHSLVGHQPGGGP